METLTPGGFDMYRGQATPSGASTPSRETSTPGGPYLQFTPKRAMASFENLVALANHQERLKEARKMVWRDRGQPVVDLKDLRACLEHAGRGGIRECPSTTSQYLLTFHRSGHTRIQY